MNSTPDVAEVARRAECHRIRDRQNDERKRHATYERAGFFDNQDQSK